MPALLILPVRREKFIGYQVVGQIGRLGQLGKTGLTKVDLQKRRPLRLP